MDLAQFWQKWKLGALTGFGITLSIGCLVVAAFFVSAALLILAIWLFGTDASDESIWQGCFILLLIFGPGALPDILRESLETSTRIFSEEPLE